jgi:endonuclease YncB( thermonuclease family)
MISKSLQTAKSPYTILLTQVRTTLMQGQRRVEQAKVRTYWQTGTDIDKHILQYAKRADYGRQVINRLALDLKVDKTTLHECVSFAKAYPKFPIVHRGVQLEWRHFRVLARIPDDKLRKRLETQAQRNGWTSDQLMARIKAEKIKSTTQIYPEPIQPISREPLKPLRGELYHYKIIRRPDARANKTDSGLRLDLGFGNLEKLSVRTAAQFVVGDIVTSYPKDGGYHFTKVVGAGDSILFTYEAIVEKVIDGDTLKVRFDQGFNFERIETLRLRGIDCPEMKTKEGVAARDFVLSYIKQADRIIVRSSRPEKYARYLADVFIPTLLLKSRLGKDEDKAKALPDEDIFLNNLLLQTGHAVRM